MTESTFRIRKAPRDKQKVREEGAEVPGVRNQERGNKEQHLSQRQNQAREEGAKGRGEGKVKEE